MKKTLKTFLTSFFSLLFIGFYFSNRLMYIKKKDEKLILDRELTAGRYRPEDFESLAKQDVTIVSPFGYKIKALLVEPHQSNRYIIIAHGVTENKVNSIKYMNLFLKRGFNAVIYDHRRHGESGGKTTSYGHYEKFDLKAVIDWLKKEKGPNLLLGIHGESMGAATMLLYAGMLEDAADFYIADCSFSSLKDQVRYQLKKDLKLPGSLIIPIGNLFLRLRDKYWITDVSPISVIDQIQHPILFIHSKKDDYILPSMTEKLFAQKQGPKMLFLAENGRHAQSLNENAADYEKAIDEFLEKYVVL
ncbi:alpha/beta hydrolase [Bacillus sp. EB600]|uniref:alpha/beta hydrolase n=1 Tax=Bacillus sp. EB600 TaxID=2806345 RepID=UPI00210E3AD9|nr:alpha/beta hydrolase [Bacillus sp. EB600]MCQ6277996.1 alpha/beta hydrolase [Bacillus sp. EB600]